jgi:large conductance mechanosensitive channel
MTKFVSFIRQQGVIGLAIGFMLGGAANGVVGSFVKDILQPTLSLVVGTESILALKVNNIMYGRFIVALIDFILLAAVVYFIFRGLRLDRVDLPKQEKVINK